MDENMQAVLAALIVGLCIFAFFSWASQKQIDSLAVTVQKMANSARDNLQTNQDLFQELMRARRDLAVEKEFHQMEQDSHEDTVKELTVEESMRKQAEEDLKQREEQICREQRQVQELEKSLRFMAKAEQNRSQELRAALEENQGLRRENLEIKQKTAQAISSLSGGNNSLPCVIVPSSQIDVAAFMRN